MAQFGCTLATGAFHESTERSQPCADGGDHKLLPAAGGGLFAISIIVSTITAAPPRSFAMLEGAYGYDSSAFWETLPPITAILFVIALIANWKTSRRWLVAAAFALFILGGLLSAMLLEPEFAKITESGYQDTVNADLQSRARSFYALDWAIWSVTLMAALALLLALARPVISKTHDIRTGSGT